MLSTYILDAPNIDLFFKLFDEAYSLDGIMNTGGYEAVKFFPLSKWKFGHQITFERE